MTLWLTKWLSVRLRTKWFRVRAQLQSLNHKETFIRKTVGDDVGFKSRVNQHISHCRTGISTSKCPIHVYHCAMKNKCLKKTFLIK